MIDDWLDGTRSRVNAKQFDMIQLVADRLKVELGLLGPGRNPCAKKVWNPCAISCTGRRAQANPTR